MARLILANAGRRTPDARPRDARGALDPRAHRRDAGRARARSSREFDFAHAVGRLYHLTFDDFCDWYAEAIKPRLYGGDEDARATALAALERLLKLLHPVMPHVTEEIWSHLPDGESRLIVSPWPEPDDAPQPTRARSTACRRRRATFRAQRRANGAGAEETRIFEAERTTGRRR